ncbi:MAG: histone deacetylase [Anaerolineales bacterium]|nr:histone deacetylase [Anaerolineales bacterium]MCA9932209.1 histone deacetylase [Anaerolineales bacterium]
MSTLMVYTPALAHTKAFHPENRGRIQRLLPALEKFGVLGELTQLYPQTATIEQLRRVHSPALIERIRAVSAQGGGLLDQGDTYATGDSYDLARLAVGGVCGLVDAIMTGRGKNGIALVRPPGHHAEFNRVSGFCLFNNVAAAARHAQAVYGVQRVMILDYDVHHGNGTQDIFYNDSSVLFISTHLFMPRYFYPGSGSLQEVGAGDGFGYTLNVPLMPDFGDEGYCRIVDELILPKVAEFRPQLILVSAGFDAHWRDPLAMAGLTLKGYARISRVLVEMAQKWSNGRILFVLEGGYEQDALTYGILNVIYALLGRDEIYDPIGANLQPEQDMTQLLLALKKRHLLF